MASKTYTISLLIGDDPVEKNFTAIGIENVLTQVRNYMWQDIMNTLDETVPVTPPNFTAQTAEDVLAAFDKRMLVRTIHRTMQELLQAMPVAAEEVQKESADDAYVPD